LVGVGHVGTNVRDVNCTGSVAVTTCSSLTDDFSDTGIAGAFGGGLDVKVNDRINIRAIQVDYNPIRIDGQTGHNFRFGVGVVSK
jgi:c-di-GMP-binding flagellar brake protein YcgR